MRKVNFISIFFLGFILFAGTSCNRKGSGSNANTVDTTLSDSKRIDAYSKKKAALIKFKFGLVEANLPSPFEIVNSIYNYNIPFKDELLNPYTNADNYNNSFKEAINYGIYGIDLAYINFYGKNQELLNYYSSTKKLADDLNVEQPFDQFSTRFKDNADNKDSIIALVDNAFTQTDAYLKKNERVLTASHVLAGALIEINYLSLNLIKDLKKDSTNSALFDKVYDENRYIHYLITLFKEYSDKDSQALYKDLSTFQGSYNEIVKSPADYTPENIDKSIKLINDIRKKLISI